MLEKVKAILENFIDVDDNVVTVDAMLTLDLGLNSFDIVNIVVAFEEEFSIEISEQDIRKLTTVGDILEYLEKSNRENL